jgi:hypothetical protein
MIVKIVRLDQRGVLDILNEFNCFEKCDSLDRIKQKHPNHKTFVAGNRWKWSRYSTSQIREEFGYPLWSDYEKGLQKGIKLHFRLLRSKNSWV